MKRRTFLGITATAAAFATAIPRALRAGPSTSETKPPGKGLKILILGGTMFLGPAIVEAARRRGHMLTLFNRGKTNPGLFPDVEQIRGDRKEAAALAGLKGRAWDAVIDTSGYLPGDVEASATLLREAVEHYVFISTVSVYGELKKRGIDETHPVAKMPPGADATKVGEATFGPLKALCEQAAERVLPGRVTLVRPGLIVGPRDPSDRFTYWPVRVARGGDVLSPGTPKDPVQFIDVRDLGEWLVTVCEKRHLGRFHAAGPRKPLTIEELLAACKAVSLSDARFLWADSRFLKEQKIEPWSDMPVWVPPDGEDAGIAAVSARRAMERGLSLRPLQETVSATLSWWATLPEARRGKMRAGLSPEREQAALAQLRAGRSAR